MDKNFKKFRQFVDSAKNIVITTHLNPDADGIGAQVALCLALKTLGKKVICIIEEDLNARYQHLDPHKLTKGFDKASKNNSVDLLIVVDTNNIDRVGSNMAKFSQRAKNILFIDHHPAPKELQKLHIIDQTKAATGELIGEIIKRLNISFTKEMALPLYTAILIDTSSFRYPTVTGGTHRLIGDLLDTGMAPHIIYNQIYGAKSVHHLRLLGEVLSKTQVNKKNTMAWIMLTQKQLEKYNVQEEDVHSFINHLLVLNNVKIAIMYLSIGKSIKISFRSVETVDVSAIAQSLGGGGHNHASACRIEGKIEDVINKTIPLIEEMLE